MHELLGCTKINNGQSAWFTVVLALLYSILLYKSTGLLLDK